MKIISIVSLIAILNIADAQSLRVTRQLATVPSSIRGLSAVNDKIVWFSGSKGYVGLSIDGGLSWTYGQVKEFETLDFRSLYAFDSKRAIIANAGSPAHILKTVDGGKTWNPVHLINHPDAFLDGIDFWDENNGLIYGDPINGKMTILKTTNGGNSWNEINVSDRPELRLGEASFAASGTGIRCLPNNNVIIATGGQVSRLWISNDGGDHWVYKQVPIVQGKNSTGIFSVATHKDRWIAVGGDYEADSLAVNHIFYSNNSGKRWTSPNKPTQGYRSGVEYIKDNIWIAVGQGGIDFSIDDGKNWIKGPDEKGLHVVRRSRNGSKIFAAGNGKVSIIEVNRQ